MIQEFLGVSPTLIGTNFIADSADVIGDVTIGRFSSVWFNVTIRGDVNWIRIGERSNVQDNSCIHVTHQTAPTDIGNNVTIGHGAIVHGCTIRDRVLVGMGSIILDHADVGSDSIIGAGALVTARTIVPPRSIVLGSPAKVVRTLTDEEIETIQYFADNYVRYSSVYLGIDKPNANPFYEPRAE